MKPCPSECAAPPHLFPWLEAIGLLVLAVGGAFFVEWIKWIWKFRKPLWQKCSYHKVPLIDTKHYYGPAWWKEAFPPPYVSYALPQWLEELHLRYPCARYGISEVGEWKELKSVIERHCPLCTEKLEAEFSMRLREEPCRYVPSWLIPISEDEIVPERLEQAADDREDK